MVSLGLQTLVSQVEVLFPFPLPPLTAILNPQLCGFIQISVLYFKHDDIRTVHDSVATLSHTLPIDHVIMAEIQARWSTCKNHTMIKRCSYNEHDLSKICF